MFNRFLVLVIIYFHNSLIAQEYFINIKAGWQLIGLPTNIKNMRVFNNEKKVRIVWNYDGKYGEWIAYSPDRAITNKIFNKGLNSLNSVERWQGLWIYSYDNWELKVDDETELQTSSPNINSIELYKGWNLISLPFNAVISPKIFQNYKIWKYGKLDSKYKTNWQTNQEYSYIDFPKPDEINGKDGFWIYSPEKRTVNLIDSSSKFLVSEDSLKSTFQTYDEVESHIKTSMFVSNRKAQYWNWTSSENRYETNINVKADLPKEKVSNSITNSNEPNIKDTIQRPDVLKKSENGYIFYRSGDKKSVLMEHVDDVLFNKVDEPIRFSSNFNHGVSYIDSFEIVKNRLIVISKMRDEKQSPTFTDRCREEKTVVSIYELNFNKITKSSQKHIFIDGDFQESRVINNNLYIVTNFKPCIELNYSKRFLNSNDDCSYPPFDTIEYQTRCYNVETDEVTKQQFRLDYDNPIIQNFYISPKYEANKNRLNLINPETFFTSSRIDQNSSLFSISHIDLIGGKIEKSSTIFGEMKNIYISENNLYFVSNRFPEYISYNDFRSRSDIHRFSYYPTIEYQASGSIQGEIFDQFSLSEKNQNLRVASKNLLSWNQKSDNNRVAVFQKQDKNLKSVGSLTNIVNESYSLAGIKFYGDIAIASANSLNQPLQIIDLTNATTPIKGGTLDIDGTSDYLYFSKSENRFISFGREISETGVKGGIEMNIIDVSNLQKPKLEKKHIFGDSYNSTPIFSDADSFNYIDIDSFISFPIYQNGGNTQNSADIGIHLFNIKKLDSNLTSIEPNSYIPFIPVKTINKFSNEIESLFVTRGDLVYMIFISQGKLDFKRIK